MAKDAVKVNLERLKNRMGDKGAFSISVVQRELAVSYSLAQKIITEGLSSGSLSRVGFNYLVNN